MPTEVMGSIYCNKTDYVRYNLKMDYRIESSDNVVETDGRASPYHGPTIDALVKQEQILTVGKDVTKSAVVDNESNRSDCSLARSAVVKKPYKCYNCGALFGKDSDLKTHMLLHTAEKPYQCAICSECYGDVVSLKSHVLTHESIVEVDEERGPFNDDDNTMDYFAEESAIDNGDAIDQKIRIKEELHVPHDMHSQDLVEERQFSKLGVVIMNKSSDRDACNDNIDFRLQVDHPNNYLFTQVDNPSCEKNPSFRNDCDKPFGCTECGKAFTSLAVLRMHVKMHSSKEYKCDVCDTTFSSEGKWNNHKVIHKLGAKRNEETATNDDGSKVIDKESVKLKTTTQSGISFRRDTFCDICEKDFKSNMLLVKHMKFHHSNRRYKCDICDRRFLNSGHLKEHITIHSGVKPFTCNICKRSFRIASMLGSHILTHNKEKPYPCQVCGKGFRQFMSLKQHMWSDHRNTDGHSQKLFHCLHCDKKYLHNFQLQSHLVTHSNERPFECSLCSKRFKRISSKNEHMRRVHCGKKPYSCMHCGEKFKVKRNLTTHLLQHDTEMEEKTHNRSSYKCNVCDEVLEDIVSLEKHVTIHEDQIGSANDEQTLCGDENLSSCALNDIAEDRNCIKQEIADGDFEDTVLENEDTNKFSDNEVDNSKIGSSVLLSLQQESLDTDNHFGDSDDDNVDDNDDDYSPKRKTVREKNNKRKSVKEINNSRGQKSGQMKTSQRKDSNASDQYCNICEKHFAHGSLLRQHMRCHSADRPHKCSICDKSFKAKAHLLEHSTIHTGEKPYSCSECSKSFRRYYSLKVHLETHNETRGYYCQFCSKKYFRKDSLQMHLLNEHNMKDFNMSGHNNDSLVEENGHDSQISVGDVAKVKSNDGDKNDDEKVVDQDDDNDGTSKRLEIVKSVQVPIDSQKQKNYCEICEKYFQNASNLKKHMACHSDERPYACSVCDKSFKTLQHLNEHSKIHTGEKPYSCDVCSKTFRRPSQLSIHMTIHEEREYSCHVCSKTYVKEESLRVHVHNEHAEFNDRQNEDNLPLCKTCNKVFPNPSLLQDHIAVAHASEKPHECAECGKSFALLMYMKRHMEQHHQSEPFKCSICDKVFAGHDNLRRHIKRHAKSKEDKVYICQVCGKNLSSAAILRKHLETHEPESIVKKFACSYCDKKFAGADTRRYHEMIHTGEKPYKCDVCGKSFRQRSTWKIHMRQHGQKPYACQLCNSSYTTKHGLEMHMPNHTGEKPFQCDVCGKSFAVKNYLVAHASIHETERPYKCEICGKGFKRRKMVTEHKQIHSEDRPFLCVLCGSSFKQNKILRQHMRVHRNDKRDTV